MLNPPVHTPPTKTVLHLIHSLRGGGTPRTLIRLLAALQPGELRHQVATLHDGALRPDGLPDRLSFVGLGKPRRAPGVAWTLARALRKERIAIIHARGLGVWVDAMLTRALLPAASLVLGFHGLEDDSGFRAREVRRIRWGLRLGARFATVGPAGQEQLVRHGGVPANRVDVLPNGVDTGQFLPASSLCRKRFRRELGYSAEHLLIGSVGSLTPVKDHASLIEAFARLVESAPHARLLLVGDGPLRGELEQRIRRRGLVDRVRLLGGQEHIASILKSLDLYVSPSASELMSNSVLEALATGLPVVATHTGDNPLLIREGRAGRLVPTRNPSALAQTLAELAADAALRTQLGRAARASADSFSQSLMVERYARYYAALADTGNAPIPREPLSTLGA